MADVFQPPPTWAQVILIDERTGNAIFNPVWLKWFVDLVGVINASGGGGGTIQHNSTGSLQGGSANQYFHLTTAEYAKVTGAIGSGTNVLGTTGLTFTPTIVGSTIAGAGTYSTQAGFYSTFMGWVIFNADIVWTATTGTGNMKIGGLPAASNATAGNFSNFSLNSNTSVAGVTAYGARLAPSSSQVDVLVYAAGVGVAAFPIQAAGNITLSGAYQT